MALDPWFIVAVGTSLLGYAIYLAGLQRRLVEPSRASWLIWGGSATVEAITYAAVNPGRMQSVVFLLSAAACMTIAALLWRRARWSMPDGPETLCMVTALSALPLWLVFRETFWAHMLVVAMVPVSFWPTWRGIWDDRARERSPAWGLWSISDLAVLILTLRSGGHGAGEYAYVLVELSCHASVWLMIGLTTINPFRSFGWREGRLRILDAYAPAVNPFAVRETHLGKAVFAAQPFRAGDPIVTFGGRRTSGSRLPRRMRGSADRFVQIARDAWLGPSGAVDDLINHCCAPNAGLRFDGAMPTLIAIRDIAVGEEISWDYSTTLADDAWSMTCACGVPGCRGTIGAFDGLSRERRDFYLARNLVAPYVRDRQRKAPGEAA